MNYLIGDVQGCCDALDRLLAKIAFSPSRDAIYVLGDLVNRGPESLETLRRLRGFGASATCLLGNHDLNLLAVAQGVRQPHRGDTIGEILDAPDRDEWLDWLRQRRMAVFEHGWLMVHAGVVPQWDAAQTMALAAEVEALLRGGALREFLPQMYGDQPARWSDALSGVARWRFVINVLTRIRFVAADGTLDLSSKEGPDGAPAGFTPWFEAKQRRTEGTPIAFGHWASLGLIDRPDLIALDTGCVWGRQLSAMRIDGGRRELIQVECGPTEHMETSALPQDLLGLCAVVLLLGLRHGFDADHLATIDALTRHHLGRGDTGARWVGALFSLGHGAVVVAVAIAVPQLASRWQVPAWLMAFGAWTSIITLVLLALLNVASLRCAAHHEHARPVGLRARWSVKLGRSGPLAAAGIGALFALSFDTLSVATLVAVSASQHGGWQGALQCGLLFTAGMLVTDGLNGLWITRLLRRSDRGALAASRWMGWAVVAVSLFTAGLGLVGQLSIGTVELPELLPGAIVVGVLLTAFLVGRRSTAAPAPKRV